MIRDALRGFWRKPAAPDPPRRVWRDRLLVAVGLAGIAVEVIFRKDLVRGPVAVAAALVSVLLLPSRRTHPLRVVLIVFGAAIALNLADRLAAGEGSIGLYTMGLILVVVYALLRWGSGRDVALGLPVMLVAFALGLTEGSTTWSDVVGGVVVFSFPGVLGVAVREWATARERELAQMRSHEREQLARELHDTVAHHMAAIVIRAQAGRVVAAADPAAAVRALEGIEEEGARTLEELRAMVGALREGGAGAELAPLGGVADLERLARAAQGRLRVDLSLEGTFEGLPAAVDAAVYRIAQESVTNALRHARGASRVEVSLVRRPDGVHVRVADDGAPVPTRGRDGFGLAGMRERADLLGGTLQAGPAGGGGWAVSAVLPTPPADPTRAERRPRADPRPDAAGPWQGGGP